jgi:hypothetical protein
MKFLPWYQLRVVVRNSASEGIGCANQFIEVPDISKNRLTLSGIVMVGKDPAKASQAAKGDPSQQVASAKESGDDEADPQASAAMRWIDFEIVK